MNERRKKIPHPPYVWAQVGKRNPEKHTLNSGKEPAVSLQMKMQSECDSPEVPFFLYDPGRGKSPLIPGLERRRNSAAMCGAA